MLTKTEARVLSFIKQYIEEHNTSPTLVEIGEEIGVTSRGTMHRYVSSLVKKGYLVQEGRVLSVPQEEGLLPFWGKIAAGRPIEAVPDVKFINVADIFLAPNRYLLQVAGDSMIEAGIYDGDIAVIEKADTANDGTIVVALINNEETSLKRLKRRNQEQIELIPENRSMRPMVLPADRVQIQGKLVVSFRTY